MRVRCVCLIVILISGSVLITRCGEEDIAESKEETVEPEETVMEKGPPPGSPFSITPAPGAIISSS